MLRRRGRELRRERCNIGDWERGRGGRTLTIGKKSKVVIGGS